jgi:hypothetical protein
MAIVAEGPSDKKCGARGVRPGFHWDKAGCGLDVRLRCSFARLAPRNRRLLTMFKTLFLAAGLAFTGGAATADAAVFTDRADFNAVLGAHTFIDFENLVGTPEFPQNYPGYPGHYSTTQPLTVGDMSFRGGIDNYILNSPFYSLNGTFIAIGWNPMVINFASAITAFGFDFGSINYTGVRYQFSIRPVGETLAEVADLPASGSSFFGYTGVAFDQVVITGGSGRYFGFDNVAFGDAASTTPGIPEPATWAMLIAGFGLVGSAARRRRVALASA